jgi:hypothetical protein
LQRSATNTSFEGLQTTVPDLFDTVVLPRLVVF